MTDLMTENELGHHLADIAFLNNGDQERIAQELGKFASMYAKACVAAALAAKAASQVSKAQALVDKAAEGLERALRKARDPD
jgi:hypothetical protein